MTSENYGWLSDVNKTWNNIFTVIPVEGTVGSCIREKGKFWDWVEYTYLGTYSLIEKGADVFSDLSLF